MRWLCDEMLGRLCRLLRAAGHDAALAGGGTADRGLLTRARAEGRVLLTRDRELSRIAGADGFFVVGETVEEQARALRAAFGVDWLLAPFTRCLMDNVPVRPAGMDDIAAMPDAARGLPGPFHRCPACGRLYWPGSHVRRMRALLERLARGEP